MVWIVGSVVFKEFMEFIELMQPSFFRLSAFYPPGLPAKDFVSPIQLTNNK
jgi:hypothetical protein